MTQPSLYRSRRQGRKGMNPRSGDMTTAGRAWCSGQKEDWSSRVPQRTRTSWSLSLVHRQIWLLVLCAVGDVAVPLWSVFPLKSWAPW